jgi:hypothetical protein
MYLLVMYVLSLVQCFSKRGARYFLGKMYSEIEMIIIPKMSGIDCLTSRIAFRKTALAATRSLRSIKAFFSHCITWNPSQTVALSSWYCQLCHQRFELFCQPTASQQLTGLATEHSYIYIYIYDSFAAPCYRNVSVLCWFGVKFWCTKPYLIICENDKFRCTFSFLLLVTLAVMIKFWVVIRGKIEIMKLLRIKTTILNSNTTFR